MSSAYKKLYEDFLRIALICFAIFLIFLMQNNRSNSYADDRDSELANIRNVFTIEISVSERKLRLYKNDIKAGKILIKEFDVATAVNGLDPQPMGMGRITKIEYNPKWYPPPITRETFKKRGIDLPAVVPPNDPLNYMGAFKIHLSHCTSRGCFYRIHGNNDKSKIGKQVTGGCIRMYNEEGLEMARIVPVGTKVMILP